MQSIWGRVCDVCEIIHLVVPEIEFPSDSVAVGEAQAILQYFCKNNHPRTAIMSQHKFEVEYAKSGRAACRACKTKIEKDDIRVGYSQDLLGLVEHQSIFLRPFCSKSGLGSAKYQQ